MAKLGFDFIRVYCLQSWCLFGWTFVILLGVISGRMVDYSRSSVTPKSPTKCESRPGRCNATKQEFHMPWGCSQSSCSANYNYRFDNNSGKESRLKANLSSTIYYPYVYKKATNTPSCLQGLNLTWTVKLNDSDLPVVGFRLHYNRYMPSKGQNKTDDTLFFLQQGEKLPMDKNGNTMFYYDCLILSVATIYRFELFSRHQSTDHISEGLERPIGAMNLRTDCDVYPDGHFTPYGGFKGFLNVSQSDSNCGVTAHFSPASHAFGFTGYNVQLMSNGRVIMKEENLPYTCETVEPVSFKNVGSGSYQITVIPVGGRCPIPNCTNSFHENISVNESNFSDACQATATSTNMLIPPFLDPTLENTPSAVREDISRVTDSEFITRNQNVVIAGAVVILAVVVVLVIVVLRFRSRKRRGEMPVSTDPYKDGDEGASGGPLNSEPVVLIYASDNSFHSEVVHRLAAYLQTHCQCDVRLDQWFQTKISEVSALDWILHQLKSVKNVIIINSEAGFRQYMAGTTDFTYEKVSHETPLADMFLPAMQDLHRDYYLKPKSRKLFKVAFPYTDPKFFLNDFHSGMTYQLMTHIEELVLNIHGLTKHSRWGKTTVVGINHNYYTQNPEGLALEKAIREATEYFKQNPRWFSDCYLIRPKNDLTNVCPSVDKDWNKEEHFFQHLFKSDHPLSFCDSGLGTSIENQNFLDNFPNNIPEVMEIAAFKAPDLGDDSSVSSANIELQAVMLNKEYDVKVGL